MKKELNQLNFNDLLIFDSIINIDSYDFNVYLTNEKHLIKGYCTRCESKGCNKCPQDASFELKNISHGTSSEDVLIATKQNSIDFSDWHSEGIIFLMEGPSKGYDIYKEIEFNGHKKRPTQFWFWVNGEHERASYPEEFKGGVYGPLFNSIIFTFKLKNAYLTNLVKCGLNNDDDGFKGIADYDKECINTCYDTFLLKEIEILKPKVIFCFGSKVYHYLQNKYPEEEFPWTVISLPHPARGQQGFSHELFRHLYYSMILEGLYESGIITIDEAKEKYGEFLVKAKRKN